MSYIRIFLEIKIFKVRDFRAATALLCAVVRVIIASNTSSKVIQSYFKITSLTLYHRIRTITVNSIYRSTMSCFDWFLNYQEKDI